MSLRTYGKRQPSTICLQAYETDVCSRQIQERVEHLYLLDLDTTITPTERLEEELKALYKGINQLEPPVCRDIIMQHFRDGVTFKEIAFRLGVSETTVYKHLRRALHQLRTYLNNK